MTVHPITDTTPACLGVCCPLHPECARYAAVEGSPAVTIGTCEQKGERPLFELSELQAADRGGAWRREVAVPVIDVEQVIYALERAERRLQDAADRLHDAGDYAAEFPAEDADRMREAITLLRAKPVEAQGA